jgi:hypothetical protein
MGEHVAQHHTAPSARKPLSKQTAQAIGRKLLDVVVYGKRCRIGQSLTLDDLVATTDIGDWKMPDYRAGCTYAASQGWLLIEGDTLKLTTAGFAAA